MFGGIGPTFFAPQRGDHPEGDGLTALQTTFAGGSSADLSLYARGTGTNSAPATVVVGTNELTVAIGGSVERSLSWTGNALARLPSTGYTAEFFVRMVETSINPASSMDRGAHIDSFNAAINRLSMNGFSGGINALVLESLASFAYTSTGDAFDILTDYKHIAFVMAPGTPVPMRAYLDGVQVAVSSSADYTKVAPYTGSVVLGGFSAASATLKFSGVRVRHAEMYTGVSFTPPISPADWGPP